MEIVHHLGTFQYEIQGLDLKGGDEASGLECHESAVESPVSRMNCWDNLVRDRVFQEGDADGSSSTSTFRYEILDGMDGVAFSTNGTCFARVDLVVCTQSSVKKHNVLSGILAVKFVSASSLLSSATWTTLYERSPSSSPSGDGKSGIGAARLAVVQGVAAADPAAPPEDDPSSSNDSLGYHMIHPSVVSLDQQKTPSDCNDSQHGPGMSI
jgi:hypothetical protein